MFEALRLWLQAATAVVTAPLLERQESPSANVMLLLRNYDDSHMRKARHEIADDEHDTGVRVSVLPRLRALRIKPLQQLLTLDVSAEDVAFLYTSALEPG
ncbi:MAG: hypothetical protein MHM6MM_005628 [Cercozoa sp. M6MM]